MLINPYINTEFKEKMMVILIYIWGLKLWEIENVVK